MEGTFTQEMPIGEVRQLSQRVRAFQSLRPQLEDGKMDLWSKNISFGIIEPTMNK